MAQGTSQYFSFFPALLLLFSSSFFKPSALNLQGCLTLATPPAFQAPFKSGGVRIAWGARGEHSRRIQLPTWKPAMKRTLEENSLSSHSSVAPNGDWRESEFLIKFSAEQRSTKGLEEALSWSRRRFLQDDRRHRSEELINTEYAECVYTCCEPCRRIPPRIMSVPSPSWN